MQGTEKQIKWAEDIKAKIDASLPDMSSNPIADKAKQFLLGIDDAAFWIEEVAPLLKNDKSDSTLGFYFLRALGKQGLLIRGTQFSDRAKMNLKTGEITITNNR